MLINDQHVLPGDYWDRWTDGYSIEMGNKS